MKILEINKNDLIYNLNLIKQRLDGKAQIIAVVKANGMGLDLEKYTNFLIQENINFFGVANTFEALALRKISKEIKILMMSEVIDEEELTDLIKNDIILTIRKFG